MTTRYPNLAATPLYNALERKIAKYCAKGYTMAEAREKAEHKLSSKAATKAPKDLERLTAKYEAAGVPHNLAMEKAGTALHDRAHARPAAPPNPERAIERMLRDGASLEDACITATAHTRIEIPVTVIRPVPPTVHHLSQARAAQRVNLSDLVARHQAAGLSLADACIQASADLKAASSVADADPGPEAA